MKRSESITGWWLRPAEETDRPAGLLAKALWDCRPADPAWIWAGEAMSAQEALLQNGQLPAEILEGKTEAARWVGESDWLYCCDWEAKLGEDAVWLHFKGVDTVADIYLNGELLASCDDMFYPHRVNVTGKLRAHNRLLIYFTAPCRAIEQARATLPAQWRDKIEPYSMLRKSPLDYLDCGRVVYVKIGLFEEVCLETVEGAELETVDVTTELGEWYHWGLVRIQGKLSRPLPGAVLEARLYGPDGSRCGKGEQRVTEDGTVSLALRLEQPQLWWPRNYGAQPLYRLQTELRSQEGALLDSSTKTLGFRRIEQTGDMRFRVNGREIKLWGSNFAPFYGPTHNWERQKERCRVQLVMAFHANMNCIRLWGGGETYGEELYEWADRLGILIWQEFFLWWGYYPETEHWRENYRREAEYHVSRLKHHACVLLWCAGNEVLMCNEESHFPQEKQELSYVIFREDYAAVCKRLDPDRLYLPTSPSGGAYPSDPREGDSHPLYYTFRHAVTDYPVFPSEIAHSSIGPLRSLRRFMDAEEIWPENYVNQLTCHSYNHFAESYAHPDQPMLAAEWKKVPIPPTWWKHCNNYFASECGPLEHFFDAEDGEQLVYRINAAFADYTKNDMEKARRGKPYHAADAARRTQGFLLWKVNDTWPQFYCTLIDYFLETHLPFYQVRRSFSPVLLSFDFQDELYLWGTNDTADTVEGELLLLSFSPSRNRICRQIKVPVRLRPGESKVITDLEELCPMVREEVLFAQLQDSEGCLIARADTLLEIERNLSFQNAGLTLGAEQGTLTVTADRFAYCVELSGEEDGDEFGWYFEDNYFNLLPFETKKVKLYTKHRKGTVSAKARYATETASIDCARLACLDL